MRAPAFKNSFVSTHEFAQRVKALHQTCGYAALELYLSNLDKNLWELDEQVADILSDPKAKKTFQDFAKEKLTNVKEADAYSNALNKTYQRLFRQNKKELQKAQEQLNKARKQERGQYKKAMKQYQKILWKREVHLMKRHGFTLKGGKGRDGGFGWYMPKPKRPVPDVYGEVQVRVSNANQYDLVAVYTVYPDRKSLHGLQQRQPELFVSELMADPGNKIPVMETEQTLLVGIAYLGKQAFFAQKRIKPNATLQYSLTLEPVSRAFIQNAINEYDNFPRHSEISKDLEYQWKKVNERKRLKRIEDEFRMMERLHSLTVHRCQQCDGGELGVAAEKYDGEALFKANCSACHKPVGQLVGPQLRGYGTNTAP
ncbi:MAG: cytochrome c [Bacteroidia bacterium]